ncbi:helix-turn-helix domain-containing protein [Belliella sp. DSM 107340]|uniref:Helix-turn-helix domain-containing protein n=1 Tax=Belliella calami TaxID=2923436 RepID=A0ABS9UKL5_9BACT|nr:helix-turn-helix domain-containing protein [Belliella calami]MCH7396975.1 helix-turn-helix domain-containing protein [Belliella calami]
MKFSLLLIIVLLTLANLNSVYIIFKNGKYGLNNKLLGFSLFFYNLILLVYFSWFEAGYILEVPHLIRSVSPLMYLSAPLFFFYVRNTIDGTQGLRKFDWLHFLPAFIHLIDLIPFYLESSAFKYALVEKIVEQPNLINQLANGLIPMSFHYPFRTILQLGYFVFTVFIVYKNGIFNAKKYPRLTRNWLMVLLILMGIIVFSHFGYSTIEMLIRYEILNYTSMGVFFFSRLALFVILLLNFYIMFKTDFISTDLQISEVRKNESKIQIHLLEKKNPIYESENVNLLDELESDYLSIKNRIEHLLHNEQVFLIKGINLPEFSKRIGIPSKTISAVINRYFGKRFNELINSYRVQFAKEKIEDGYLDDYTIDSLSENVGFNSRVTFFNAFKKETGSSPNEYWKNFQNGNL